MLICNAVLTDADGARPGDVRIENGVITAVGEGLSTGGDTVLDAGGRTLLPAFIDLHCHFRTPGFEYKEDIDSGSRAAARGGYTFVNCMANTRPVCSSAAIAQSIMDDARRIGLCDVNQCVSITKDFDGKTTGHLRALPRNIRFISEDGKGVRESRVMYEAMRIAAEKGLTVMSHAEDMDLSALDYRLAENLETARNLYLAQSTGARLHMCHVSTKEALADILPPGPVRVTQGDAPPHLVLDSDFRGTRPFGQKRMWKRSSRPCCGRGGDRDRPCPHTEEDKARRRAGHGGAGDAFSVCYTNCAGIRCRWQT
ncbi:MAG: amidohydrolase family protein [Ruthenibacterium lactatiformans]